MPALAVAPVLPLVRTASQGRQQRSSAWHDHCGKSTVSGRRLGSPAYAAQVRTNKSPWVRRLESLEPLLGARACVLCSELVSPHRARLKCAASPKLPYPQGFLGLS